MKNRKIEKMQGMTITLITLVIIMVTTGAVWAGRGMGTGSVTNIFDGLAVEITGTVAAVGMFGQGYQVIQGQRLSQSMDSALSGSGIVLDLTDLRWEKRSQSRAMRSFSLMGATKP